MINFFVPEIKVQKHRGIMRETDLRVAKYSRRGLLFTLLAFAICMLIGQYQHLKPQMTITLCVVLLLLILIRGYYLFRFDTLYSRGPNRWRNTYFFISLIGAAWWSFSVASVTLAVGIEHETPLLWLYSTVFYSSVTHAFAPYKRFLSMYLFIGIVPIAFSAIWLAEPMSLFYGLIMLVLFLLLNNQGSVICRNYWDRLQANYNLTKRANALEAERIDTQSSIANSNTFLNNLSQELKSSLQEITGTLRLLECSQLSKDDKQLVTLAEQMNVRQMAILDNVMEFSQITNRELVTDPSIINPRSSIERAIETISIASHKRGVELYSTYATQLPIRVRADATRIEQMVTNLVTSSFKYCNKGELVINVNYQQLDDIDGKLIIDIVNETPSNTSEDEQLLFDAFNANRAGDMNIGLSLAITKGLAECMGGSAGIDYANDKAMRFWFSIKVETVTKSNPDTINIPKLNGKRVLLYQPPEKIVSTFIHTLNDWGMDIEVVNQQEQGLAKLQGATAASNPFDIAIVYTQLNSLASLAFSEHLASHDSYRTLPQILVMSPIQQTIEAVQYHLNQHIYVHPLLKPIKQRNVLQLIKQLLIEKSVPINRQQDDNWLDNKAILLLQTEEIDRVIAEGMLKNLGCSVTSVTTIEAAIAQSSEHSFDAFITESHLKDTDIKAVVTTIKQQQSQQQETVFPVLGLAAHITDSEETFCLASGMDGHIEKPIQLDTLRTLLSRWIGRQHKTNLPEDNN